MKRWLCASGAALFFALLSPGGCLIAAASQRPLYTPACNSPLTIGDNLVSAHRSNTIVAEMLLDFRGKAVAWIFVDDVSHIWLYEMPSISREALAGLGHHANGGGTFLIRAHSFPRGYTLAPCLAHYD